MCIYIYVYVYISICVCMCVGLYTIYYIIYIYVCVCMIPFPKNGPSALEFSCYKMPQSGSQFLCIKTGVIACKKNNFPYCCNLDQPRGSPFFVVLCFPPFRPFGMVRCERKKPTRSSCSKMLQQ